MFCSKNLTNSVKDVPSGWIFENYLSLNEQLSGQSVKLKSVFNSKDSNPSMHIFYSIKLQQYWFKDFSSGHTGSAMDMLMLLWNTDFGSAAQRVLNDYTSFKLKGGNATRDIIPVNPWEFTNVHQRAWNTDDVAYWGQYHLGSGILNHYNVIPIRCYNMTKLDNGTVSEFTVSSKNIYGYYSKDGTLCKIYQPRNLERKFFKVNDYLQGSDQMTYKKPYLVICSSLKDAMCLRAMKMEVDVVAPDSENATIPITVLEQWVEHYDVVMTLFDNDAAGIKSMKNYRDKYNIPFAWLRMEKDLSDAVKVHGLQTVKLRIAPIIMRQIEAFRADKLLSMTPSF
jgi:hypothetical protein